MGCEWVEVGTERVPGRRNVTSTTARLAVLRDWRWNGRTGPHVLSATGLAMRLGNLPWRTGSRLKVT